MLYEKDEVNKMYLCTCEEDLICENCTCSEACDVDGFVLCNAERASMGNLVRSDTFCCDKGEWGSKVLVTRYRRGLSVDAKDEEYQEERVRVDSKSYILAALSNGGQYDY